MIGKQHKMMTVPLSVMIITILYKYFGYNVAHYATVPVAYFFATAPDMDQPNSTPKEWKTIKAVAILSVAFIFVAAVIGLFYSANKYLNETDPEKLNLILKNIAVCFIVIVIYAVTYYYISKDGKFLAAHRGFTHTLVVPAVGYLSYSHLISDEISVTTVIAYIIFGASLGWACHIVEDMFCKAGAPILWPISPTKISIGGAITAGKNRGEAHISSWIYTVLISVVSLFVAAFVYIYME